jgi:hypothetical protein
VGTFLDLLRWWLEHERPVSPEQMDAIFQQLVLLGMLTAIGEHSTQG